MKTDGRYKLIRAVFARAGELGISQEMLRDTIAPATIGKRLSKASAREIAKVIDYITRKAGNRETDHGKRTTGNGSRKKYESSREGLLQEIRDLAIERFGEDFISPLNNLCARFGESDGYRKMKIAGLKELKRRLIELQREDPWG